MKISAFGLRLLALVVALGTAACTPREEPIVERFFAASRARDTTALREFSSVIFEPRELGIVRTFTITSVSPEHSNGAVVMKDVTVRARVVMFDGSTDERTLMLTLQQVDERQSPYRWKVIAARELTPGAEARSAPPL